uniref:RNase H type-1 domain-containing protein n=1 Tax=Rousettus aegyptiacus TaxID=9407 RepID=A0A7J8HSG7_ROUAE|nr:hypothetical protein HJG63_010988 [Rousettus aegyptiacus]
MNNQGHKWLTNARITHYQGLLCENLGVCLETVRTLSPATFLPTKEGPPDHDCEEGTDEVYPSRPDLTEVSLWDPELVLFTDESSFIHKGQCKAGYTITDEVIRTEALPQGWSSQQAKLWALIQALGQAEGKRANIYTNSRCAFATLHVQETVYREGITDAGRKTDQEQRRNPPTARGTLEASKVAVIHCKGYQRRMNPVSRGNRRADQAVKEAACQPIVTTGPKSSSSIHLAPELAPSPKYTKEEEQWTSRRKEG